MGTNMDFGGKSGICLLGKQFCPPQVFHSKNYVAYNL